MDECNKWGEVCPGEQGMLFRFQKVEHTETETAEPQTAQEGWLPDLEDWFNGSRVLDVIARKMWLQDE